jgi:hypothetical protein
MKQQWVPLAGKKPHCYTGLIRTQKSSLLQMALLFSATQVGTLEDLCTLSRAASDLQLTFVMVVVGDIAD